MSEIELCGALHAQKVFHHYTYEDMHPGYARFVAEEDPAPAHEAITIYAACQREKGHTGKHLASSNDGWAE